VHFGAVSLSPGEAALFPAGSKDWAFAQMKDIDAVRELYRGVLDAWNRRDAEAMTQLYAPKGGQVGFDGSVANGPDEILAHLQPVFADHPTASFVAKVREVRLLGPDAALLRAVAGMVPPGQSDINPELNTIQTMVASRQDDGRWLVEMFHNTPAAFHGRPHERGFLTEELRTVAPKSD
jgi:uncharacterized protein (TIGR02246 family)